MRNHNINYILNEFNKLGMLENDKDLEYHKQHLENLSDTELQNIKKQILLTDRTSKLLDIKEHLYTLIQDNSYYNFIYDYYSKIDDIQHDKEYYQDVMRFLTVAYICVSRCYTFFEKYKLEKESSNKHQRLKDKLIISLKSNIEDIENNYKNSLINALSQQKQNEVDITTHTLCSNEINNILTEYKTLNNKLIELLEQKDNTWLHIQSNYDKDYNYLLSRELDSKNGIRILYIKYIYCILQICDIDNKKLVYELSKYLLPEKHSSSLIDNDVYKIIRQINIHDNKQNYLETFDAIYHVMTSGSIYNHDLYHSPKKIDRTQFKDDILYKNYITWGKTNITFTLWKEFIIRQQKLNNIEYTNLFLF